MPGRRPAAPVQTTGCAQLATLFQDPLLEEPPGSGASAEVRHRYENLERAAGNTCRRCPLLQPCLYRAVVEVEVAGYAGATTARERLAMRARLGVTVVPEDFDTLAGVPRSSQQVDHDEVVRLRRTHPQESLEQLAARLGCSLSTVKRHLRAERRDPRPTRPAEARPTAADVAAAYDQVIRGRRPALDTAA